MNKNDKKYDKNIDEILGELFSFRTARRRENIDDLKEIYNIMGSPCKNCRIIHIAGTNGKGSCSHTIAAILQSAGYKVGLYTSPHLIDFRERIRNN